MAVNSFDVHVRLFADGRPLTHAGLEAFSRMAALIGVPVTVLTDGEAEQLFGPYTEPMGLTQTPTPEAKPGGMKNFIGKWPTKMTSAEFYKATEDE